MKVVYAYSCLPGENTSDLHKYPSQLEAFKLSLLSWRKFEPTARLCLYCDRVVKDLIYRSKLNILLTDIQEIDFRQELDSLTFFALPKIWAACQQTEPFFICDTDMILLKRLNLNTGDDRVKAFQVYDFLQNTNFSKFTQKDIDSFNKIQQLTQLDPTLCVNGGLLYFPRVEVAIKAYSYVWDVNKLELKNSVTSRALSWVFLEEAPLRNKIIELEGKDIELFKSGTFFEVTEDSQEFREKWIQNRIQSSVKPLGFI